MSDVNVTIGADLRELKAKLGEASEHVAHFGHGLVREGRSARHFSEMIALIGGASEGAAGLLGNMLAGFAMGGPMGLAMASVNILISKIKESGAEEEEVAKKAKEAHERIRKEYDKTTTAVARLHYVQAGGSGAAFDAYGEVEAARREQAIAKKEADAKQAALAKYVGARPGLSEPGTDLEALGKSMPELARLLEGVSAAKDNLDKLTVIATNHEELYGQVARDAATSVAEADRKAANERRETALKLYEEDTKRLHTKVELQHKLAVEQANEAGEIDNFLRAAAKRDEERAAARLAARTAEIEWWREFNNKVEEVERKIREDEERELQARAANYVAWGDKVGASLAKALTGSLTPLKAMTGLLKDITSAIIEMAQKQIMASALAASAEAAKSQSGIPVVGPILAGGAMVAMLGMVRGLIGQLPSAARGWDIPRGINPLTQLHGGEMVLPEEDADVIRNGGRRPALELHVNTMDAKSFYDALKDRDSELFRVLAEGMADRRF